MVNLPGLWTINMDVRGGRYQWVYLNGLVERMVEVMKGCRIYYASMIRRMMWRRIVVVVVVAAWYCRLRKV